MIKMSNLFSRVTNALLYAACALAIVEVLVLMYYVIRITCALLMSGVIIN